MSTNSMIYLDTIKTVAHSYVLKMWHLPKEGATCQHYNFQLQFS